MSRRSGGAPPRHRTPAESTPGGARALAREHAAPPEPVTLPWVVTALLAAACIVAAVTVRLFDTDVWQHLLVGRVIWSTHSVPTRQLWSWPTWGAPDTTTSYAWLFRALLWPAWLAGGVVGLQVWRWATTLVAFALAWATGRVVGARGLAPLWVAVLAALAYRQRSQVRPETLSVVLLALLLLLLERRRRGAGVPAGWLVLLMWLWVNVHVTWVVGLFVLGVFAVDEAWRARRGGPVAARCTRPEHAGRPPARPAEGGHAGTPPPPTGAIRLWHVALISVAAAFVNPYGWRAVWQPVHFAVMAREPLLRSIGELRAIDWRFNLRNGLPLLLALGAAGVVWQWRRGRGDPVAALLLAAFALFGLRNSRFMGFFAIVAVPYVARDVSQWLAARRLPPRDAWGRAGVASIAMLLLLPAELLRRDLQPGIGLAGASVPVAACDFVAREHVRGRCFNSFEFGGYLLWRFWPDRDRLPFMDIHQSGTPAERLRYLTAQADPAAWRDVAERYRLEWCMLRRVHAAGDHLLDFLDADSTWALVFVDDVAAVYVRRMGALAPVASRLGYRLLPGGTARLASFDTLMAQPAARATLRAELRRAIASSPRCSSPWSILSALDSREERFAESRDDLERAYDIDPGVPLYWERRRAIEENLARRPAR
jgi:hypothetical protein